MMEEPEIIELAIFESTKFYPRFWRKFCRRKAMIFAEVIFDLRKCGNNIEADRLKQKLGIMLRTWQQKSWPTILPNLDQRFGESLDDCVDRSYIAAGFVSLGKVKGNWRR